jgi:hypothetical protein
MGSPFRPTYKDAAGNRRESARTVKKLSRAASPYIHNISVNGSIALSGG